MQWAICTTLIWVEINIFLRYQSLNLADLVHITYMRNKYMLNRLFSCSCSCSSCYCFSSSHCFCLYLPFIYVCLSVTPCLSLSLLPFSFCLCIYLSSIYLSSLFPICLSFQNNMVNFYSRCYFCGNLKNQCCLQIKVSVFQLTKLDSKKCNSYSLF